MRWSWVLVPLAAGAALVAAACGGKSATPVITEGVVRQALLGSEDLPPGFAGFATPSVNVLTPGMLRDVGIYRIKLCERRTPPEYVREGPPWVLAGSLVSGGPPIPSNVDEYIVVYAGVDGARQDLAYFKDLFGYCEQHQADPNDTYNSLSFPRIGDESFAFIARPQPGTPAARERRPDEHEVLIRRANVIISLGYIEAPATDAAVTLALARRALERLDRAVGAGGRP